MHVILIGNYEYDRQESMQRFARMLENGLRNAGVTVELIRPEPLFGRLKPAATGVGKWLGYLDKFVLFPLQLRKRVAHLRRVGNSTGVGVHVIVHICDHSNAHYTKYLENVPHLVTCHDLLAVRSAKGEIPENPTGWTGRQLQKLILGGLDHAAYVACVSEATRKDLLRLSELGRERVCVVPNGLNFPYSPMPPQEADARLDGLLLGLQNPSGATDVGDRSRYLLHVGGNQWYKNRLGVLKIYAGLAHRAEAELPKLIMAGQAFTPEMEQFIAENREVAANIIPVTGAENEDLRALYSSAELLLFPSLTEGFGWPIIEAQACGCRVLTTRKEPMTDVGGNAALYIDPADLQGAIDAALQLLHESADERRTRIEKGIAHAQRFSLGGMIDNYIALYDRLVSGRSKSTSSREGIAA